MRLVCFGDSNTYGYDPRSFLGERYPLRWTVLLAQRSGREVLELGQNGRAIPASAGALTPLLQPDDVLVLLLGSNDLLLGASAAETERRMERFLRSLPPCRVLLTAPPPMLPGQWVTEERLLRESSALADAYRSLAQALGIPFADAGEWNVALSFDGVHFTEQGHRAFALGLQKALAGLFL